FMDIDRIYFELQRHKSEKRWFNLIIPKHKIADLLKDSTWYTLYAPPQMLEYRSFSRVHVWEEMALALLKKYCHRFYSYMRAAAEAPHLRYVELVPDDENFIEGDQYTIRVDEADTILLKQLEDLQQTISRLRTAIASNDFHGIQLAGFDVRLKPLF